MNQGIDSLFVDVDVSINGRSLEYVAAAEILPGHLVERIPPDMQTIQPHSTAAGTLTPIVALRDVYRGSGFDVPYEIGATVHVKYCLPGDLFMGRIVGTTDPVFVESNGDGTLRPVSASPPTDSSVVGLILEFVDFDEGYAVVEVL